MKRLKLSVGLCGFLASLNAWSVGLGEIRTESGLNQPFLARIPLTDVSEAQLEALRVTLAPVSRFEAAGLPVNSSVLALRFSVASDESGRAEVVITTEQPMREPIVDFLLEATWPAGQLVREFTVLLDPPNYRESATTVPASPAAPAPLAEVAPPDRSAPVRPAQYGPVRSGETLYAIALRTAAPGVDVNQMMVALRDANPDAFINGNINALRQGARLMVPSLAEAQRLTSAEAAAEVRAQSQQWRRETRPEAPATPPQVATTTQTTEVEVAEEGSRLRLVAPEAGAGAVNATESVTAAQVPDNTLLQEEVDARQRENRDLSAKLKEANEIIQLLQRQIEFKDSELAALQQRIMALQSEKPMEDDAPAPSDTDTTPMADAPATEAALEEGSAEAAPMDDAELEALLALPELEDIEVGETAPVRPAAERTPDEAPRLPEADVEPVADPAEPVQSDAEASDPEQASESPASAVEPPAAPQPATAPGILGQAQAVLAGVEARVASLVPPHILGVIPGGIRALLGGLVLALLVVVLLARRLSGRGAKTITQAPLPVEPLTREDRLETTVEQALQTQKDTVSEDDEGAPLARTLSQKDAESMVDDELDPLEEMNVYLAYERFDQAEALVREAIEREPEVAQYRLRLLEVFYSANDKEKYEAAARELRDRVGEQSPLWETALAMWNEMSPSRALFSAEDLGATMAETTGSSAFVNLAGDDDAPLTVPPDFLDLTETTETPGEDDLSDLTGTGDLSGLALQGEDLLDVSKGSLGASDALFDITGGETKATTADDNILEFDLEDTVSPPLARTTMLLDDTHDSLTTASIPDSSMPPRVEPTETRSTIEAADAAADRQRDDAERAAPAAPKDDNSIDFDIGGLAVDPADETWDPETEDAGAADAGDVASSDSDNGAEADDIESPSFQADSADTLDFNFALGETTEVSRAEVEDTLELPRDVMPSAGDAPLSDVDALAGLGGAELELTLDFDLGEADSGEADDALVGLEGAIDLTATAVLENGPAQFRATRGETTGADAPSLDELDIDLTVEASELGLDIGSDDSGEDADLTLDELAKTLVSNEGAVSSLDMASESASATPEATGPDDTFDLDIFGEEMAAGEADDASGLLLSDDESVDEPTRKMAPGDTDPLTGGAASAVDEDGSLDLDFGADLDLDFASMADSDDEGALSLDDTGDFTTQLNLARAYIELGDHDGARNILNEVRSKGSEAEKSQAIELLARLG